MTEKTLTWSQGLSSADVAALLSTITRPIILLSASCGVGSAIWLAVLGEWSALGKGLALALFMTVITWVAYSRCARELNMVANLARAGWPILAFPLSLLLQLAANGHVTVWCAVICGGFPAESHPGDFWPRLLWSYALASGSLMAATYPGGANGPAIKVVTTFFAQLAFVPMIIAIVFFKPTLLQLIMVFGSVMIVSCLVQMVDFVRIVSNRSA